MTPHKLTKNPHLSEAQMEAMLGSSSADTLSDSHLLNCERCTAELTSLRASLSIFRDATRAYADAELRCVPGMTVPSRRLISPALEPAWLLAAAALMLAAMLPVQMQRMRAVRTTALYASASTITASAQSDEALLDDIDRESYASLPSSMQTLANPSTTLEQSTQLDSQRKVQP